MRIIVAIVALRLVLGLPPKDPNIKQFEKEFHELLTSSEEEKGAEILAENEAQIDKQHQLYLEGKATFDEALMPWDTLSSEELIREKTGLLIGQGRKVYPTGLIETPPELAVNSPEHQAILDEVYARYERQAPKASYDARKEGICQLKVL